MMKGFSTQVRALLDRWSLACTPAELRRVLADHIGRPVTLKAMRGLGPASVFRVDGPGDEPVAIVRVVNWRRERKSQRVIEPSPHFRFFPGAERLAREFEILGKLAPHGLSPRPLLLAEHFALHEYCPGDLLLEQLGRKPVKAFEAGWKALRRVHALGVHHGDPIPQNIIDGPEGLRFIDFEHSLDEERYDFDHMMAFDCLRYCQRSWRFSANLDVTIIRQYLLEGEGGLSGPVAEAVAEFMVSIPFYRSFIALVGGIN